MRLAIIGTGKMGSAIVKGLLDKNILPANQITGSDSNAEARRSFLALDSRGQLHWSDTVTDAAKNADVILIAVKPQNISALLPQLQAAAANTLFISIAAGITLARLEQVLGSQRPIFRVMPNTPLMVGEGVTAYAANRQISAEHPGILNRLFGATGQVFAVDEAQLDAVTALSGSGPAFMAWIIAALAKAAQAEGLPESAALAMALQTMRGSATLLQHSGMTPEQLIQQVASKGGTTEAGLQVLQHSDLNRVLAQTIQAAAARSRELNGE